MKILIPIETSIRELTYKVYFIHSLVGKGFHCYLGNKLAIMYLVRRLNNYIFVDMGYHKGVSDSVYQTVKQNNGIIVNLDEEGAVDFSDGSTLLKRYSKTLFSNADLTCLWGSKQYELLKQNMNRENKVLVTGHPRFELLKPEFHYLYQDEVEEINNKISNFILINTNMGFGNNIKGDEFVTSNYGSRFKNINQIIAFDKKKLESYRLLTIKLSQKLNKIIVLRPHPEENQSFYLNAFKGMKNIHIINEGSVVPWLIAADVVIHPDCTTAIEALLIGKQPISFLPDNYPKELATELPIKASKCFTSPSKIIEYIKKNLNKFDPPNLDKFNFLEENFNFPKASTEMIIENLSKYVSSNNMGLKLSLSCKEKLYVNYLSLKSILIKNESTKLHQKKIKGFDINNINKILNVINQNKQSGHNLFINKISRSLFYFTP